MRKSVIAVLPLLLIMCGAQTPPTATEAFNLRIRCKQMAEQKADELGRRIISRAARVYGEKLMT